MRQRQLPCASAAVASRARPSRAARPRGHIDERDRLAPDLQGRGRGRQLGCSITGRCTDRGSTQGRPLRSPPPGGAQDGASAARLRLLRLSQCERQQRRPSARAPASARFGFCLVAMGRAPLSIAEEGLWLRTATTHGRGQARPWACSRAPSAGAWAMSPSGRMSRVALVHCTCLVRGKDAHAPDPQHHPFCLLP